MTATPVYQEAADSHRPAAAHGISERFYFKLKAAGRGSAEMHLGNRVLISREAAARWRAEREAESPPPRLARRA